MHPTAQTTEPPPNPAPPQERAAPPYIAFLLNVARVLLRYGRHFDDTIPQKAAHRRFPTLAAGFGTTSAASSPVRGILRAMMLQRFLLARAPKTATSNPNAPPNPRRSKRWT
jgi:hypothetical protein